ncbi:Type IV secretion system protein VirB4 [Paraburkholderia tropica]|uniref:VirB4 family type IV secretion/conjugal transfer ATPase n=1 Tax=Paraburkholderia tropica TaxID=92647 RepID=UPI001CAC21E1|nr:transporter [Paraburkholderia tropica]CAG9235710.1 Type IV secretion system protein VirB4 [Paraburkholderia tropica]
MSAQLSSTPIENLIRNMPPVAEWMPKVGRPISRRISTMEDRRMFFNIKLMGIPFESVNDQVLESAFENLTDMLTALGRDHGRKVQLWTTFRRRKVSFNGRYAFSSEFCERFAFKYLQRFREGEYFENAFYITLLFSYDDFDDGLKQIEQMADGMEKQLAAYDPEFLETFERNGIQFSNAYKFYSELVNGEEQEVAVTTAPGAELIPDAWLHFGYEVLEIRTDTGTKYATCYDLKDFPKAGWGQLNPLLSLPVEFTITQSFGSMTSYQADKAITGQINKLQSANDKATHQVTELEDARKYVASNELAFGDYHGALVVYGPTAKRALDNGDLVKVRSKGECGFGWVKATASAPFTYFSQVPGARKLPRPMPKSSRSLACAFTLHDYSAGKSRGNPLGDGTAVMPLQTTSKKLYSFNYHATRDDDNNAGEKIAGHTLFLGSTGTGKTTTQLAMVAFVERFDPMIFALDIGRGMEIFIRQLGGSYITLTEGVPTGLAPFELEDTPGNRQFLYDLVGMCGKDNEGKLTASEKDQIKKAVDTIMELKVVEQRVFSRLLESIPYTGGDCLSLRLSQWCHAAEGRYAWVFDNVPGTMLDVTTQKRIGIDITAFLRDRYEPAEPVFTYLLHLKKLMQREGQLLCTIVEEFWMPIKFEMPRRMMEAALAAGRKAGEFLVLVTQQPAQAMQSEIFPLIRSQTATKIFLPDPAAEWSEYKACGLTEKEFAELKKLGKASRTFLVKQSNQSAFATLDLKGFDDEIAVLSASIESVALMEAAIAEHGEDPDAWREPFLERVFINRQIAKLLPEYGTDRSKWQHILDTRVADRRKRIEAEDRSFRAAMAEMA